MPDQIKGKVVIDKNAVPLTPDTLVRALFGMPMEQLVRDIRENRGGKYDELYSDGGEQSDGKPI